jgi:hypothetical protein
MYTATSGIVLPDDHHRLAAASQLKPGNVEVGDGLSS